MIKDKINYSLDDVSIIPAITGLNSRSECDPFYCQSSPNLPIFCAPMTAVCDTENYDLFRKNKIIPMLPRTIGLRIRLEKCTDVWCAFGLEEFEENFVKKPVHTNDFTFACIDVANGHMPMVAQVISGAKSRNSHVYIMAGNVANPWTYMALAEAGADFVRVGIGGGACCLTSTNTGVHFPMASLLEQCKFIKTTNGLKAGIVADGGIDDYGKAVKALALGADYVMMGTMLAKCFESAAKPSGHGTKKIFGMSTPIAQELIDKTKPIRPTEGLVREIPIEYTIEDFSKNFEAYLRSAMAYTNCKRLQDFTSGKVELNIMNNKCYNNLYNS